MIKIKKTFKLLIKRCWISHLPRLINANLVSVPHRIILLRFFLQVTVSLLFSAVSNSSSQFVNVDLRKKKAFWEISFLKHRGLFLMLILNQYPCPVGLVLVKMADGPVETTCLLPSQHYLQLFVVTTCKPDQTQLEQDLHTTSGAWRIQHFLLSSLEFSLLLLGFKPSPTCWKTGVELFKLWEVLLVSYSLFIHFSSKHMNYDGLLMMGRSRDVGEEGGGRGGIICRELDGRLTTFSLLLGKDSLFFSQVLCEWRRFSL